MAGDGKLKSCSAKQWVLANGKPTASGPPRNAGLALNGPVGFLLARAELLILVPVGSYVDYLLYRRAQRGT